MIKSMFVGVLSLVAAMMAAQQATIPGQVTCPFPTLENLAVEWEIAGDDNLNCRVAVLYRIVGESAWKQGMDLFRVPAGKNIGFTWKNKLSGSLFGLLPDTEYEIRLKLEDPDGGHAEETLHARTRPVPAITADVRIIPIQPGVYNTLETENGTPEHPIAYVCREGTAIYSRIDLTDRKWVMLVGLSVENPEKEGIGIRMNGAEHCAVIRCNVHAVYGIVGYKPGITNCYISDNTLNGICPWTNRAMGAHGENLGEGIEITGPGNVICYNRVTGFRDCISTMEDQHVVNQTCIDIYGNDINLGVDDAVEADFCFSNCRIYGNRITNCFVGLSSQPGLGGPNYFFRNSMYNLTHGAFKLKRFSRGDVVMHNTVVKAGAGLGGNDSMDYAWFRNNLAIGGPDGGIKWGDYGAGRPSAADIIKPKAHCSFDYDAVGVEGIPYVALIGNRPFSSVEVHGLEGVTLDNLFNGVPFPFPPVPEKPVPDLRLKAGAKVIDAGMLIPNVNDHFNGTAPDIGAYEYGQELPHYGPRENASLKNEPQPALYFREDWKEIPAATPVTQEHVSNPLLVLNLYGPGADSIKKSHHDRPVDDPYYIWSGLCTGNWAVTLRKKGACADLSNYARIVLRSKQSGFRQLHLVVKLADGTWLVSDQSAGPSRDWKVTEFNLSDISWNTLDIVTVTEGQPAGAPDLTQVEEIGFTDLMRGGQSDACSRLDWMEVYGGTRDEGQGEI